MSLTLCCSPKDRPRHPDWAPGRHAFLQVADKLEKAVMHVLEQGYRTGDLMSNGMKQIGCSALGNVIEGYLQDA